MMLIGFNCNLKVQIKLLQQIIEENEYLYKILSRADNINLSNWYIGASCITTTVWNKISGYDLNKYLNDIDIVYYDRSDISEEGEQKHQSHVRKLNKDIPVKIDVKNQARVHIWYRKKFGKQIKQYKSVEDGINTWLSVTSIAVKKEKRDFIVYAPYGLNDLFGRIVRPNKKLITKDHYIIKTNRWKKQWPQIEVIPWD